MQEDISQSRQISLELTPEELAVWRATTRLWDQLLGEPKPSVDDPEELLADLDSSLAAGSVVAQLDFGFDEADEVPAAGGSEEEIPLGVIDTTDIDLDEVRAQSREISYGLGQSTLSLLLLRREPKHFEGGEKVVYVARILSSDLKAEDRDAKVAELRWRQAWIAEMEISLEAEEAGQYAINIEFDAETGKPQFQMVATTEG